MAFKTAKAKLSTHASQWFDAAVDVLVLSYTFFTMWSNDVTFSKTLAKKY